MSLCFAEGLGVTLLGPQELDAWLVGTVRALQENMLDVQGRLQSLENKPQPPEQVRSPSLISKSRTRLLQNFVSALGSSSSHFCLCHHASTCLQLCAKNGVASVAGREVRGSNVLPPWRESGKRTLPRLSTSA